METLHDAHARAWEHLFVGRERELAALDEWLSAPEGPTCVFSVTGMGGIGKSTLLRQMAYRARRAGARTVWVDGRACTRTPAGLLAYLTTATVVASAPVPSASGEEPPGEVSPGRSLAAVASWARAAGPRVVWCIDNYEELEALDGWFRDGFLAELPAVGHLIVLASRQQLPGGWHSDPVWRQRLRALAMQPLTAAEARDYLQRVGVPGGAVDELVRQAGGLPLALSVAAHAYQARPGASDPPVGPVVHAVTANLLREVAGAELEQVLDVLAFVGEADPDLLRRILGRPVPLQDLVALERLSFVQRTATGYRLHEVARRYLLEELRQRDPERFRRSRERAVAALLPRLAEGTRAARGTAAASLLELCADALPSVPSYANLSTWRSSPSRSPVPEDLPRLKKLLRDWGNQPLPLPDPARYEELLERIVFQFPEGCRVVVGSDGRPAAFMAAPLLARDTVACVEEVAPGTLRRLFPWEYDRLAALPPEKADTYFALLLGADAEHEEYSDQELTGILIRDGLARLGEGTRAIVCGSHPGLVSLLTQLGFTRYMGAGPGPGPRRRVHTLDLRDGRFGPWVVSLLARMEGKREAGYARALASLPELRRLTGALHEPEQWRRSPLPAALGWDPEALRLRVQRLLAPGGPLVPPLTAYDRDVLRSVAEGLVPAAAAAQLHVSRATYYRHLERALEHLHQVISAPPSTHSPSEMRKPHEASPR